IRQHLKQFGLDWDWPEFPPEDPGTDIRQTLKVEILLRDLDRPSQPRLKPEEQARQIIETSRRRLAANANDAVACNNLAWAYLTPPEEFRDVNAALPLAEKAVKLDPGNGFYANTLGVAQYRNGRYREAVNVLRANLARAEDRYLAFDLYFLAMSYQKLGESEHALDYYEWAVRWPRTDPRLTPGLLEELDMFRAEASDVIGITAKGDVENAPMPREIKK